MLLFRYVLMTIAFGWLATAAAAADTHIRATLVSETAAPAPGTRFTLALAMAPDKGWHGYWRNTGDAGMETLTKWSLPKGVSAGPLTYPVPERLMISGLMNYVYEGPYALLVSIDIPAGMKVGTALPIRVEADWLACTDSICVPEKDSLALDLVVGDGHVTPEQQARFDGWRAAQPKPLGGAGRYALDSGKIRLAIPLPASVALADPYFYPLTKDALEYAAQQTFSRSGDTLIVETAASKGAAPGRIEGVLKIGEGNGLTISAMPGTVPRNGKPVGQGAGQQSMDLAAFALTLGGAILGGLLLNIMPCVFPILSLKALSLARAGEDAHHARRDALAYAAGIILVCVGLGVTLLALRSGGAALGWAFQLQDPRVITMLLLLTGAIGFNLAGLFELPMLTGGERLAGTGGAAGSFWTGALAAFVATPCTGPFMAAALGAALVLPAAAAIAIFLGLGLGLALPFLLLGFVPALRRKLPKPGAWMATLRHILSLPMFATALGLAWILGRQAGVDAMALGLALLILVIVALWWVGRRQIMGRSGAWWPVLPALLIAAVAVAEMPIATVKGEGSSTSDSIAFSEPRLHALRVEGKPIFLYFTADWCLTCKVNEKAAIDRAEVKEAFRKQGVTVMVGDWTRGDAGIGRFLARHGRSGVPFYLFYPRGDGEPQALPQILTPGLLAALAK